MTEPVTPELAGALVRAQGVTPTPESAAAERIGKSIHPGLRCAA